MDFRNSANETRRAEVLHPRKLPTYLVVVGVLATLLLTPCVPVPEPPPTVSWPDEPPKWSFAIVFLPDWNREGLIANVRYHGEEVTMGQTMMAIAVWFVVTVMVARAAWRAAIFARSRWRSMNNRCVACGYRQHDHGGRCPECGSPFKQRATRIPFVKVTVYSLLTLIILNLLGVVLARHADWSWRVSHSFMDYVGGHPQLGVEGAYTEWSQWSARTSVPGLAEGTASSSIFSDRAVTPSAQVYMRAGWPVRWFDHVVRARPDLNTLAPHPETGVPQELLRAVDGAVTERHAAVDMRAVIWCFVSLVGLSLIVGANAPAARIAPIRSTHR